MPADEPSTLAPDDVATTLRVLATLHEMDRDDPHYVAVRQATANMFKEVKLASRKAKHARIQAADKAVIAATATGAPDRIDDETRGIPLATRAAAPTAGTLLKSRGCYICKQQYTLVDAFYHQLCPDCARLSHAKRDARTDLTVGEILVERIEVMSGTVNAVYENERRVLGRRS